MSKLEELAEAVRVAAALWELRTSEEESAKERLRVASKALERADEAACAANLALVSYAASQP